MRNSSPSKKICRTALVALLVLWIGGCASLPSAWNSGEKPQYTEAVSDFVGLERPS